MCDTMIHRNAKRGRTIFAKNSDRDPGEPQLIQYCPDPVSDFHNRPFDEDLPKYSKGPFLRLKAVFDNYDHPYGALVSRPSWIWGAEMGINDCGVSIGNEAVFSKEKTSPDGLLGMDILRLALHNGATASEALQFIIGIIETCGQGGNGSYKGNLEYHNSFIIADGKEAYVLETSGHHWAWKKAEKNASISNAYSLGNDISKADPESIKHNFKKRYENRLYTFFSRGDKRQSFTFSSTGKDDMTPEDFKALLRSHITADGKRSGKMDSICMHSRGVVKSETTSSLIVDYLSDRQVIWYTGSPYPCVSLFKPLILTEKTKEVLSNRDHVMSAALGNRSLSEKLLNDPLFDREIKELRDETERQMHRIIYDRFESKTDEELSEDLDRCRKIEDQYISKVTGLSG